MPCLVHLSGKIFIICQVYRENGNAVLGTTEICAETYLTNEEGPTITGRLSNYHDDGNDRLKMIKLNSKLISI